MGHNSRSICEGWWRAPVCGAKCPPPGHPTFTESTRAAGSSRQGEAGNFVKSTRAYGPRAQQTEEETRGMGKGEHRHPDWRAAAGLAASCRACADRAAALVGSWGVSKLAWRQSSGPLHKLYRPKIECSLINSKGNTTSDPGCFKVSVFNKLRTQALPGVRWSLQAIRWVVSDILSHGW